MSNVSRWLEIKKEELDKYVGKERDEFVFKKLKEAGFDITKHIGTKRVKGSWRFIQNFIKENEAQDVR